MDPTSKELATWHEMMKSVKGVKRSGSADTTPDRANATKSVGKYELRESEMVPLNKELDAARANKYMEEMFEKLGLD